MIRKVAAMLALLGVLLAGCAPSYDAALLSSVEGRWQCDVQRYTFDTQADIQAELDARLAGSGITAEQYRAFKDDLTKDPDLRRQVKDVYDARCAP